MRGVTELPCETQGNSLVSFVQMVYQSSQPEIFALWENPLADRRGRLSLRVKFNPCEDFIQYKFTPLMATKKENP